ncbi:MAG: pseudouridine synthase [Candidatus Izemoplasmatales bacterium]
MRINQFISSSGYCSRRAADKLIEEKRVVVNQQIATIGMEISPNDQLFIDGVLLKDRPDYIYMLYNKPKGIESTTDTSKPGNIIDAIHFHERIFPIGRLDKDSTGLIMLTNHGDIVNKILRSENHHEKEYHVRVDKEITSAFLESMSQGLEIYNPVKHQNQITKPAQCKKIGSKQFSIILTEGLNLQIRRMSKALGYRVFELDRVRIMNLHKGNIPLGEYRLLSENEVSSLMKMLD